MPVLIRKQRIINDIERNRWRNTDASNKHTALQRVGTGQLFGRKLSTPLPQRRHVGTHRITNARKRLRTFVAYKESRKLVRMLHAHATVAHSAVFFREHILGRGIVQVNREVVIKAEDDAPQRVTLAALLNNEVVATLQHGRCYVLRTHGFARTAFTDKIVMRLEIAHIAQPRYNTFPDYAARNNPLRVDIHALYSATEQRCLGFKRPASYAHGNHFILIDRPQLKRRDIDQHISAFLLRRIVKPPTAAFEID